MITNLFTYTLVTLARVIAHHCMAETAHGLGIGMLESAEDEFYPIPARSRACLHCELSLMLPKKIVMYVCVVDSFSDRWKFCDALVKIGEHVECCLHL